MSSRYGTAGPSHAGLRELLEQGALLLDVRTRDEFACGHVAGARNAPVDQLPSIIPTLGDLTRPVIVYCRSGVRSSRAAALLRARGFRKVYDAGSMSNVPI